MTKNVLDKMSREELEKLFTQLTEVKRREDNNSLEKYNTGEKVHKKQQVFHGCKKRNRWVFGRQQDRQN